MATTYSFTEDGIASLGDSLDAKRCRALYERVILDRGFSPEIFLSEERYRANPVRRHVNPIQGQRNLIENYDAAFIEENPGFATALSNVLGSGYKIERRKFVVSLPEAWVPDWVRTEVDGVSSANINPYVHPEFRDVTYMQGIDYHQDMIDFRDREPDFVTCYIYLHTVGEGDSPIHLVPGSHKFGATVFPHDLEILEGGSRLRYRADEKHVEEFSTHRVTGEAGDGYFWHSCVLHGTQLHTGNVPRVSIRYIIQKDLADSDTLIDQTNRELDRSGMLAKTRVDVDEKGAFQSTTNVIASYADED